MRYEFAVLRSNKRSQTIMSESPDVSGRALGSNSTSTQSPQQDGDPAPTAVSRTPPWLASGWGCPSRRLSRGSVWNADAFHERVETGVAVQGVVVGTKIACVEPQVQPFSSGQSVASGLGQPTTGRYGPLTCSSLASVCDHVAVPCPRTTDLPISSAATEPSHGDR